LCNSNKNVKLRKIRELLSVAETDERQNFKQSNMKKTSLLFILLAVASIANAANKTEISELLNKVGEVKQIDPFDQKGLIYHTKQYDWCKDASLTWEPTEEDKIEGKGSFLINYSFAGYTSDPNLPEFVSIKRRWDNYRCDFSFHPLGISFWIKGKSSNKGTLSFVLLQDEQEAPGVGVERHTFKYTDNTKVLKKGKWTRVVIPFSEFKPESNDGTPLMLNKIFGWRLEITNTDGKPAADNSFYIDNLQQLTSYHPDLNKKARFSSVFIQLSPKYANTDWEKEFQDFLDAGIDTWIIQYCLGHKKFRNTSYYKNCNLSWIETKYDIVDKMFVAAEKMGIKLVVGPLFEYYEKAPLDKLDRYEEMHADNIQVVDELAANFGHYKSFTGWYVADEFHDGKMPGRTWQPEAATQCLAWYLEANASHMKEKLNLPVAVAPALWRGFSAEMSGDFFYRLFQMTPSVDILYLQDCAGRGPDPTTSVGVDLPNYFEKIKVACDKSGVQFGVDIESFFHSNWYKMPYRAKTWEELSKQLWVAGMFTDYITNFSYATFKPAYPSFQEYKKYIKELDKTK